VKIPAKTGVLGRLNGVVCLGSGSGSGKNCIR
jgi:hypothetical protein